MAGVGWSASQLESWVLGCLKTTVIERVIVRGSEHFQATHLGDRRGWGKNESLSPHPGAAPCPMQAPVQRDFIKT